MRNARRAPVGYPAPMRWRDGVELCVLALLWGSAYLFTRSAVPEFGAVPLVAMRVGIAALELAPYNIRVAAVAPGRVDTPMLRAGMERDHVTGSSIHERLENLASKTVNGRIGQPEEIARAIYFLADSTQSSFMTGQALVVDGGATARLSTE